jgi:hypothetical protein
LLVEQALQNALISLFLSGSCSETGISEQLLVILWKEESAHCYSAETAG